MQTRDRVKVDSPPFKDHAGLDCAWICGLAIRVKGSLLPRHKEGLAGTIKSETVEAYGLSFGKLKQ